MTADEAIAFVRKHGVVLSAAKGPVPNVSEAVAGGPVKGSWWSHPQGREIFRVLRSLSDSPDILVCRLVDGKITFVHRRLWPALVRVAHRFDPRQIAQVHEEHTASGRHVTHDVAFPEWVPSEVKSLARELSEREALEALGEWTERLEVPGGGRANSRSRGKKK